MCTQYRKMRFCGRHLHCVCIRINLILFQRTLVLLSSLSEDFASVAVVSSDILKTSFHRYARAFQVLSDVVQLGCREGQFESKFLSDQ